MGARDTQHAPDVSERPLHDLNNEAEITLGGRARSILDEVVSMLEHLLSKVEEGVIDLNKISISPDDYQQLQYVLGKGRLTANIDGMGRSVVQETAISGVWWTTRYSDGGERITDQIEITHLPQLLQSSKDNMKQGLKELRHRIEVDIPHYLDE